MPTIEFPGASKGPARRRRWPRRATAATLAFGVIVLIVTAQVRAQSSARRELATRFQLRAASAADFMGVYANSVLEREQHLAATRLNGPAVSDAAFASFREDFGFGPSVLLDRDGRDLLVAPSNPAVVGTDLTVRYAHLKSAHDGVPSVSNVVGSAARNAPIVAFAVPFDTPSGQRVVSGGFDLRTTPLGLYLDHILPAGVGTSDLVDANGKIVVAREDGAAAPNPGLLAAIASKPSGEFHPARSHVHGYYATAPVRGTPWRVVLTSSTAALYQPANKATGTMPWLIIALVSCLAGLIAFEFIRSQEARGSLEVVAGRDVLTGLPNRRESQVRLEQLVANARRYNEPLSLLMVDIDHFKTINDTHGHPGGDTALCAVADRIGASIREGDVAGRWGGEEFVVALPRTDADAAQLIGERIRFATAALPVLSDPHAVTVTVSIGVATGIDEGSAALVSMADGALYRAKRGGRDQVIAHDPAPPFTH